MKVLSDCKMYVRVRRKQRKHGAIIYAVLGWSEWLKTGGVKFYDDTYLGSIRESHLDDPSQLWKFWKRVRDILLNNFSQHDCNIFFKKIGRDIPRPRRITGTDDGIIISWFKICPPYGRRIKH